MHAYHTHREEGVCTFPSVIGPELIEACLAEARRLYDYGGRFGEATDEGPVKWLVVPSDKGAPVLRGLWRVHRISAPFERARSHPGVFEILCPLLGERMKTVASTLFWKRPRESHSGFALHQDAFFRKPREKFRNLATSCIQLAVAIERHGSENGGIRFFASSHVKGEFELPGRRGVLLDGIDAFDPAARGLENCLEVDIRPEPGDVVIWSPFVVHDSPAYTHATRTLFASAAPAPIRLRAPTDEPPVSWQPGPTRAAAPTATSHPIVVRPSIRALSATAMSG